MKAMRAMRVAKDALMGAAFALGVDVAPRAPVNLVAENAEWAILWVARYVCRGANAVRPGIAALSSRPDLARNRVLHFGTRDLWLAARGRVDPSNRIVVTSLHGNPDDGGHFRTSLHGFIDSLASVSGVVTSTRIMERRLLDLGVPRERLHVIPLGVDTATFVPPTAAERQAARRAFGVPDERLCIGSFQKDGEGWADGLEPKWVKGPDVFVDAVARLGGELPVFVLLTGPARGYVKARLDSIGIPYVHRILDDYTRLVTAYHALDMYVVSSREEGGPLALMESMATGVPVVATAVGMVPEALRHGENGMVAPSEDWAALAEHAGRVLTDAGLRRRLVDHAVADVAEYDWPVIARRYYAEVYAPLLRELGREPSSACAGDGNGEGG